MSATQYLHRSVCRCLGRRSFPRISTAYGRTMASSTGQLFNSAIAIRATYIGHQCPKQYPKIPCPLSLESQPNSIATPPVIATSPSAPDIIFSRPSARVLCCSSLADDLMYFDATRVFTTLADCRPVSQLGQAVLVLMWSLLLIS